MQRGIGWGLITIWIGHGCWLWWQCNIFLLCVSLQCGWIIDPMPTEEENNQGFAQPSYPHRPPNSQDNNRLYPSLPLANWVKFEYQERFNVGCRNFTPLLQVVATFSPWRFHQRCSENCMLVLGSDWNCQSMPASIWIVTILFYSLGLHLGFIWNVENWNEDVSWKVLLSVCRGVVILSWKFAFKVCSNFQMGSTGPWLAVS